MGRPTRWCLACLLLASVLASSACTDTQAESSSEEARSPSSYPSYRDQSDEIRDVIVESLPGATGVDIRSDGWERPVRHVEGFPPNEYWEGGRHYVGRVYFGSGDTRIERPFDFREVEGDPGKVCEALRPYIPSVPGAAGSPALTDDEFEAFVNWYRPATGQTEIGGFATLQENLTVGDLPAEMRPSEAPSDAEVLTVSPFGPLMQPSGERKLSPLVALDRQTSRWYLVAVDGLDALEELGF